MTFLLSIGFESGRGYHISHVGYDGNTGGRRLRSGAKCYEASRQGALVVLLVHPASPSSAHLQLRKHVR